MARQNTWETALAERVVYVVTDVTLPLAAGSRTATRSGRRLTAPPGKSSFWSLCAVPEAEAKEMLLGQVDPEDPRRAPMLEALTEDGGDSQRSLQDQLSAGHPARRRAGHSLSGELPRVCCSLGCAGGQS